MKKIVALILLVALVLSLNVSALAGEDDYTNYKFGFTAGTTNGTMADYGYSSNYKQKQSTKNYIEVRHAVPESTSGFTNLIAAKERDGNSVGSKWMASNSIYYSTNGGCSITKFYAPCGRGNTKYSEQDGLTSITIEGQFRVH